MKMKRFVDIKAFLGFVVLVLLSGSALHYFFDVDLVFALAIMVVAILGNGALIALEDRKRNRK